LTFLGVPAALFSAWRCKNQTSYHSPEHVAGFGITAQSDLCALHALIFFEVIPV
jgi:hypothetical protein